MISGPRWVIFCICSEFDFPSSKKFFSPQFLTKKFRSWKFIFDGLKFSFLRSVNHAESYSPFLANSIFQFQRNFFNLNFWPKNFDLKNWFFDGLKYGFFWLAYHGESYSAFLGNSIFQFQINFFHLNFWPKNFDLENLFLMGSSLVFCDQWTTLSHILHLQRILFSNFKEIFLTSISDEKISILKIDFLMGSNIVFPD